MQTKAGAVKMKQSMIERHGSEEAWKEWMRDNARKGGQAQVPKGFALCSPELLKAYGKKGGRISRRTKSID